jgi:hypothetical protein
VVGRSLEAAAGAHVDVAAQSGRPTDGHRAQGLPLLARERLLPAHGRSMGSHDRGDVEPTRMRPGGTAAGTHGAHHGAARALRGGR